MKYYDGQLNDRQRSVMSRTLTSALRQFTLLTHRPLPPGLTFAPWTFPRNGVTGLTIQTVATKIGAIFTKQTRWAICKTTIIPTMNSP